MSAKDLVFTGRGCSLLQVAGVPQVGQSINIAGRESTDYNIVLQDFFRTVIQSQPNEDEEDTIGVLYLTRSESTRQRLEFLCGQERAIVGLEWVVQTYNKFHATEITDIMADLDRMEFRYLIIEDVDGFSEDLILGLRQLRHTAEDKFLLVTSSRLNRQADEIASIENDSMDFVQSMRGSGYDIYPKLPQEVDVQLIVEQCSAAEEGYVGFDIAVSKYRGKPEVANRISRVSRPIEVYQR